MCQVWINRLPSGSNSLPPVQHSGLAGETVRVLGAPGGGVLPFRMIPLNEAVSGGGMSLVQPRGDDRADVYQRWADDGATHRERMNHLGGLRPEGPLP